MVAVAAAAMNVAKALARSTLEVIAAVALPIVRAIGIIKRAIISSIAVVVAVVIVRASDGDANAADMDSDAHLGISRWCADLANAGAAGR
jgi:hypothetical protein